MNAFEIEYNGFFGELVKLERTIQPWSYKLKIFDREKKVFYFFENVNPENIKFLTCKEKCGHWEENKTPISVGYTCSFCGGTMYCCSVRNPEELPKYCLKCGAKMIQ